MRLEFLQKDIGRDFKDDVGYEEDRQRNIVLHARRNVQVVREAQSSRITDIDPIHPMINISARVLKSGSQSGNHTDPGKPKGRARRDMAKCASQSWPLAFALWLIEAEEAHGRWTDCRLVLERPGRRQFPI
jgi:hypothetical protein